MFNYKIGNPNKVAQAYSWLTMNHYGELDDNAVKVVAKMESVVTPTEIKALNDFSKLDANWFLDLPVPNLMDGNLMIIWIAEQIGQYGSYWAALLRHPSKPASLFHLSAPDSERLFALIQYLGDYFRGDIKVSAEDLLVKVDKFMLEELPEGVTDFFNVSFKRGKTYAK